MHVSLPRCGQTLLGLALLLGSGAALAASLAVLPVRIELTGKRPIAALTVRNDGDSASVVQLEPMQWTQQDGTDAYAATREILASPPIFTLPPGGAQIVRVGLRRAADPARELSYRLFLQEVPPPPAPGFKGLRVALRFGVPVFVAPAAPAALGASLDWQARLQGGAAVVSAVNRSPMHIEITHLDLVAHDSGTVFRGDVQNYLLPGQRHDWRFDGAPAGAAGTALHVAAASDSGPIRTDIVIAPR